MPITWSGLSSLPLDVSSHSRRPLPTLSRTTYQSASIVFITISVLFAIPLCYRIILDKPTSPSLSLPDPSNGKQNSKTLQTALTTPPGYIVPLSPPQDHQSPVELSGLPKPTVRQFQQPFPTALALANRTVTTNTTWVIGSSPRSVTRSDTVQHLNGCRRHVMVLG